MNRRKKITQQRRIQLDAILLRIENETDTDQDNTNYMNWLKPYLTFDPDVVINYTEAWELAHAERSSRKYKRRNF